MEKQAKKQTILGVDPGTRITGYGIIQLDASSYLPLDFGCICPSVKLSLPERYFAIFQGMEKLFAIHVIDAVAIENQYVRKNAQSALKLGMAKGAAILAAVKNKIPIFEYAPTQAKLAVVGKGGATKQQVQRMIQVLLHLPAPPYPEDAADALALAICHSHYMKEH